MSDKERIMAALNKLVKNDPNFASNIEKLAKLSETNKLIYNQAVNKLKML